MYQEIDEVRAFLEGRFSINNKIEKKKQVWKTGFNDLLVSEDSRAALFVPDAASEFV